MPISDPIRTVVLYPLDSKRNASLIFFQYSQCGADFAGFSFAIESHGDSSDLQPSAMISTPFKNYKKDHLIAEASNRSTTVE